jgi:uncharacterized membrane protein YdjX (TVP38/TMEM64 family)
MTVLPPTPTPRPTDRGDPRDRWWIRPLVLGALLTAGVVVATAVGLPTVTDLRAGLASAGWAAPVLYAALYAGLTLTPTPATALSIAAGLLFGLPAGLAVVMTGALIGASTAFGLSRTLGRQAVTRLDSQRLRRLDELLRRRGLLAVIGVRLLPLLPFGPLNYACGLTDVGVRHYLLGTAIGILPAALAFVTIGAYGDMPGSMPFLVAVGGLALLTLAGAVAARGHRTVGRSSSAATAISRPDGRSVRTAPPA